MRALIIGDGWVANNRHKPALRKLGIVCSSYDKNKPKPIEGKFDFSVICTPPQERLKALKFAHEYGGKKIFLEKPIATSKEDAEKILNYCLDNNITARSCHNFLFSKIGSIILQSKEISTPIFIQLNRKDRVLPKWISEIPRGISLDEFPHFGYLARAIYPEQGLRSEKLTLVENNNSNVNRWQIELVTLEGYLVCDLWRDQVYFSKATNQKKYWQYTEEYSEGIQRLLNLTNRITKRILFRKSNDFGTLEMWRSFINNSLTPEQEKLTSLHLSKSILEDFFEIYKQ